MGLDGIAGVQSRIAGIQQRFAAPRAASLASTSSTASAEPDFATLLAEAGDDATAAMRGTGAASAPLVPAAGASPAARAFVGEALRQAGDPYVWGSHAAPTDADPAAFDCSELTRWAAQRVGVDLPDGSWLQYLRLKEQGALVPVETALRTPGALLFSFATEPRPGAGRPADAHVAISLGDGRTIEARGKRYGVGTFDAADRFQYGALIPGLA